MDWKYKHFHQERVFPAPPGEVAEAARAYLTGPLGWQVEERPDGFVASGYSFSHAGIANVHIQPSGGGTRVAIDLLVERAGPTGFMLFDVGGYYNIQIRKWLDGIQWGIHQSVAGPQSESPNPHQPSTSKGAALVFNGCLVFAAVVFGLLLLVNLISALVGLFTGNLMLFGRGGTITMHGVIARVVSGLILAFGAFICWKVIKHRPQRPAILPPK